MQITDLTTGQAEQNAATIARNTATRADVQKALDSAMNDRDRLTFAIVKAQRVGDWPKAEKLANDRDPLVSRVLSLRAELEGAGN